MYSECPIQKDIEQCESSEKAQEIIDEYYGQIFINDYKEYIEKLTARLLDIDLSTNPFMNKKKN